MKNFIYLFLTSLLLTSCFKKETSEISFDNIDSATAIVDTTTAILDSGVIPENQIPITDTLSDYELAEKENTSSAWKRFIENNPNHKNVEEIKEKIIRLEVQEIMADQNTGTMPESEKISERNTITSSIEVSNNTGCKLTLRYSENDAISVSIPANSTKKIRISSGNYSVAASACGYNYAGTENLNGDYSVTYYISSQYR